MSDALKDILGELPLTAELFWLLRSDREKKDKYSLRGLRAVLPESLKAVSDAVKEKAVGKKVFFFATRYHWIEHTAMVSLALVGMGHQVTLATIPFTNISKPSSRFEARRRDIYTRQALRPARHFLKHISFLDFKTGIDLPDVLRKQVELASLYDAQYILQAEEIDRQDPVYLLRLERNLSAAGACLAYLQKFRPDVVIVPNGVILEFAVVYAVARYLDIPTVTYEFGEQANRAWLAQNAQIIKHETDDLWQARKDLPLTSEQREWLVNFFAARQTTQRGEKFARLWQETGTRGGQAMRAELGLDDRPVVLLTTNVLGDSLTLGRQLFNETMSEWIERLVKYFADRRDAQLLIRIHPGENLTKGPSLTGVIQRALPVLPDHIHLIGAQEKINTYDLMEIADLGLVYTTTTGLEMATRGIPVMTAGKTHYRKRGFTIDADTYEDYFTNLDRFLRNLPAHRMTPAQVELAWNYAYRFFHEYPRPFPWHILHLRENFKKKPLNYVLSPEGQAEYASTFRYFVGEPLDWKTVD
jgi:hypothetical protein